MSKRTKQPTISDFFRPAAAKNGKPKPEVPEVPVTPATPTAPQRSVPTSPAELPDSRITQTSTASSTGHSSSTSQPLKDFRFGTTNGNEPLSHKITESEELYKRHNAFVSTLNAAGGIEGLKRRRLERKALATDPQSHETEISPSPNPANPSNPAKLTPLEQQIRELKLQHRDKLLAVQVGYKYKFFAEDAVAAASVLSVMLVPGRMRIDSDDPRYSRFAYCSVPDATIGMHTRRLLEHGYKVGIARQLETAAIKAAGAGRSQLFSREVTEVYTKGTYCGFADLIDGESGNGNGNGSGNGSGSNSSYLLSIYETAASEAGTTVALFAVNPATGHLLYDLFRDSALRQETDTRLQHVEPAEILIIGEISGATKRLLNSYRHPTAGPPRLVPIAAPPRTKVAETVAKLFSGIQSYTELSLSPNVETCMACMYDYLTEFGLQSAVADPTAFQSLQTATGMTLNGNTLRGLEIFYNAADQKERGSLFWFLNHTNSAAGARMLRQWLARPLVDVEKIRDRLTAVAELRDATSSATTASQGQSGGLLGPFRATLKRAPDLERAGLKLANQRCSPAELRAVLDSVNELGAVASNAAPQVESPLLKTLLETVAQAATLLRPTRDLIKPGGSCDTQTAHANEYFTSEGLQAFPEISAAYSEIQACEAALVAQLEDIRRQLRRPYLEYRQSGKESYLIEVKVAEVSRVPSNWVKISGSRQVARFRPPEVAQQLKQLEYAQAVLIETRQAAFRAFQAQLASEHFGTLRSVAGAVAQLDCLLSLATVALLPGYVQPQLRHSSEPQLRLRKSRNPLLEQLLPPGVLCVPNDVELCRERQLVITGPNMGGKSSFARQVALTAVLAQIGSFVPAEEAELGIFDAVFVRLGAEDDLLRGRSTFAVELGECAEIMKRATPKSLVVLDEIGRGTDTVNGVAIAEAVLRYFAELGVALLFTTHYPLLHTVAAEYARLGAVHMGYLVAQPGSEAEEVTFLYEVRRGAGGGSYGLNVARVAGLPAEVLRVARATSEARRAELGAKVGRDFVDNAGSGEKSGAADGNGSGSAAVKWGMLRMALKGDELSVKELWDSEVAGGEEAVAQQAGVA